MIPEKLVIKNFLSHSHSVVDFNNFDIALIVGAYDGNEDQSNGAGKTAVLDGIMWSLFGKSRHRKKDGIVKRDTKCCEVEFSFKIEKKLYRIIRRRDKVLGESDVIFEQWNNSKYENISCDTNTATDKKIIETINVNSDVFINSVYFKQNDISLFAEAKPSQRKDILRALLRMEKWDSYQKRAREMKNSFKGKLTEKENLSVSVDIIKEEIKKCANELAKLKKDIGDINKEYDTNKSNLSQLREEYYRIHDSNNTLSDLKSLQNKLAEAQSRLKEIDKSKKNNDAIIKKGTEDISALQFKMAKLNDFIESASSIDIDSTRKNLMAGRTKEKILEKKVSDLKKEVSLEDECDSCGKLLTAQDKKDITIKRQKKFEEAQAKHAKVKMELQKFEKQAALREDKVKKSHEAALEKSKVALRGSKIKAEVERCARENKRLDEEIKILKAKDYEKQISDLKLKFDKDKCEKMMNEITNIDSILEKLIRKKDDLNIKYGSLTTKKKELIEKEKQQIKLNKEISDCQEQFAIYDKLYSYFGKEGVQAVIIENVIGELEEYANNTLSKICNEPTAIKIKTQRQNDNGSWSETFDIEVTAGGRTDEFDTFSGGEKFRISFALRLALSKILSKRMGGALKFLLLDEVSSSLDDKGLEMFITIVKQLSGDLKILVISHDEKLKESFDDILVVNKTASGSSISLAA